MLTILKSIGSAIVSVFTFLVNTVKTLFSFLGKIPQFLTFIRSLLSFVPDIFIQFALIGLAAFAILFIVGRNKA